MDTILEDARNYSAPGELDIKDIKTAVAGSAGVLVSWKAGPADSLRELAGCTSCSSRNLWLSMTLECYNAVFT